VLLGYGFCLPDNPCDEVGMRLAQPPPIIHEALQQTMPDHFKSKEFDPTEFIFRIRGSKHYTGGYENPMRDHGITCARGIPEEMALTLQLLASYGIMPESHDPLRKEAELWYATFDLLLQRLQATRQQITRWDAELPSKPQNQCQQAAMIYRNGQLDILNEVIGELEDFIGPLEQGMDYMERFGHLVQDPDYRTY
jgi:hypothetical protein